MSSSAWPTIPAPAGLMSNRYKPTDMPDLHGKVAVVVGGSRGIGQAVATAMAMKGAEVHIIGATPDHLQTATEEITTAAPDASSRLHTHTVDLGSLRSVISLSETLSSSLSRLDNLFLIAGVGVAPFGLTKDGLGNHFAINNVSHLAVLDVLLPLMKKTAKDKEGTDEAWTTRIVSESSELHRAAPGDAKFASVEEMTEQSKDMDETLLYNRSKLGNILLMRNVAERLPPSQIMAISTHPGAVGTEQQRGATEAYGKILGGIIEGAGNYLFMHKEQGAESALWAGTSPNVVERRGEVQGRYFSEADGKVDTETNQAKDEELRKNFWKICVQALKEKADYEVKL